MRDELIENIICRDRGENDYIHYSAFKCTGFELISKAVQETLASIPPSFGSCVMISSGLVSILRSQYSIPAIAVLGTLNINGSTVFECKENIPLFNNDEEAIESIWDGHCWVEIDGVICDLSIFRSAYRINSSSVLYKYIQSNFGEGKGAIVSSVKDLPRGLEFQPKFVLNNNQIMAVLSGLAEQQSKNI